MNQRQVVLPQSQAQAPIQRPLINKVTPSLDACLDHLDLKDGMAISFHHHFRNGDVLLNQVVQKLAQRGIKDITLIASSLFDVHEAIIPYIKDETITQIVSGYISKAVGQVISAGHLKKGVILHSHGYRSLLLNHHVMEVDVAFLAVSAADSVGNGTGLQGQSLCGSLGYAVSDATSAKHVVLLTDTITDLDDVQIQGQWVDAVVRVDHVGDATGIVSGTTNITKDPTGLFIAKLATDLCDVADLIVDGMAFQAGAGGISLAVCQMMAERLQAKEMQAKFVSGGTTKILVDMLEAGLTKRIYDVQCFDLEAIASLKHNPEHHAISAFDYADVSNPNNIANQLDVVFLGATEIDLDYNVNVTTASDGTIMGGSGGHCDVANGSKFTIIVSKLMQSRLSVIVDQVLTISTPSVDVDALVTEFGIAIHPRHQALIDTLKATTSLPIKTIRELYDFAISLTGQPNKIAFEERVVGVSLYRDGTKLDDLYQITETSD
jgi:citrate lyase subunit alpha/citrate CoA-transferase